ncbi:uncharacterized protein B0H18DRAFT_83574 [Fomitopsis serialis]|uniref:uncharacterized protein n=1 Tax=Fomitopsis serialis TaxID=139415 RepID=UPI002008B3EE|nr:uncharacterized protein B0H18DRAFT_83574 [Neoantrodia serialis]KAH9931424.1 hypothetical protein B0H18DRAFT_83574 [Neoantrodia serialis]
MAWRRMRLIFLFAKPCMASRSCSGLSVGSAAFNVLYCTRERITRGFRQPYSRHTVGSGTVNYGRTDGYTVRVQAPRCVIRSRRWQPNRRHASRRSTCPDPSVRPDHSCSGIRHSLCK